MALSANTAVDVRKGDEQTSRHPVGTGVTIYQGERVAIVQTSGRAVVATATTSRRFAGLSAESGAVTGNTAGTVYVKVKWGIPAYLPVVATQVTELAQRIGQNAYMGASNSVTTATDAGTAAVRVALGQVIEVDAAAAHAWVWLRHFDV